ncbi:hypothetical protein IIQ44_01820 [Acinetobacter oleivorans]|uniref:hypothetical protein n=1 Tax=Acinetobacter TaxID=469 RepID=UPI000CE39280|nr:MULTISPECIES: hypothetical protein [Acinetobacter]MBE2170639.1 hypothetical protein [Acinetobacter oleivorans]MDY7372189.1 hypothetical protein [Acinetobacter oleivorans]PPC03320.1 hypothetical protein ApiMCR53_00515 [Acinetobacter pittii]WPP78557.1 hypothetical protein SOI71_06930 [Acinetobacter pittii]
MKSILNIEKNIFELENILNKKQKIEELESSIQQLFSIILKDYPYLKLPTFSIIPTRALEFIVWYQDPNAITETLLIKQNSFTAYLWRCDDEKWYLDDLYSEPREIASKLIKNIPVFYSIPENPKEVKYLLEIGIMHFNEILFPIFSNRTLEDSREVLTWDDHFLLVGTQLTNLKLYSHEEWNALIDRENSYLN